MKTTRSRSNLLELFFFFNKLHFTQTSLLIHQPSIHTLYSCHTVVATLRTDDRSYKGIEPPPQKPFSQFFFFCFFQILCRVRQRRDLKVKVEMSREYADPYRLQTPPAPPPPGEDLLYRTCIYKNKRVGRLRDVWTAWSTVRPIRL